MAIKLKTNSKDEIPAALAGHYVERDGAWVLDVDGVVDKSKLEEFRSNNVDLLKQLEEQKKRFEASVGSHYLHFSLSFQASADRNSASSRTLKSCNSSGFGCVHLHRSHPRPRHFGMVVASFLSDEPVSNLSVPPAEHGPEKYES